jgi:hypothetical protein
MARCGLSLSKRTTVFHKNELQRNIGCYFLSFKDTTGNESQLEFKWKNEFFFKIYAALNGGVDKVIGTCMNKV